jgi:hypothetical protein
MYSTSIESQCGGIAEVNTWMRVAVTSNIPKNQRLVDAMKAKDSSP